MDTHFAPAERATDDQLKEEIGKVATNPIIHELLHSIGGLIAVLDEHRQVVGLNDSFLETLGVEDPSAVLGLRLGEALGCIHSHDEPSGCGTTRYCSTCGAVIAMVAALEGEEPVEKLCSLSTYKGETAVDYAIMVRATILKLEGQKFILLFLHDVTLEHLRAALERTFFHDMGNMFTGLLGASQFLVRENQSEMALMIHRAALRLHKELEIQRCLFKSNFLEYRPSRDDTTAAELLAELNGIFSKHDATNDKSLLLPDSLPLLSVKTDKSLALRVMANMVLNALEATEEHGEVKVWFEQEQDALDFYVWNEKAIPDDVQCRIFQRSFSTKEGSGRGVGTFSMQLIGEKILGGKISFSSSTQQGTLFKFRLPAH
ncbi:sensor histidine kinase [Geomonas subterranea]|uniref:Sensor histidine kinase n=1 Tax=Geomonas subterranea TaxID=2847989 RepID=A0ABX8LFI0_9BACT|nr:sensor histidine kinase [Geomonas subterranea]QXE89139.1 sensor histidine kinase [Geomonas subterranea]QXM08744.1 sensor histidine kinase [Geomonas subterranea]